MPRAATCADCGKSYRVKDSLAGRTMPCRECGGAVAIPGGDALPPMPSSRRYGGKSAPKPGKRRAAAPGKPAKGQKGGGKAKTAASGGGRTVAGMPLGLAVAAGACGLLFFGGAAAVAVFVLPKMGESVSSIAESTKPEVDENADEADPSGDFFNAMLSGTESEHESPQAFLADVAARQAEKDAAEYERINAARAAEGLDPVEPEDPLAALNGQIDGYFDREDQRKQNREERLAREREEREAAAAATAPKKAGRGGK